MPDPSASPQPKRPRRFWLWAPYVALLVALIAWTCVWWVESTRLKAALDDQAAQLRGRGYTAAWSGAKIDGWPFRLRLVLTAPSFGDRSGWGLAAPRLLAQAMAYTPDSWVIAAPDGLTFTRPGKGPLLVVGKQIRASVAALGTDRPRFAFEGLALALAAGPGAQPAPFAAIDRLELDAQPGPDDQGAFLIRLDGGALLPSTELARLALGKPFSLEWDARLSHVSKAQGSSWSAALQAWTAAGGDMTIANARISLGGLTLVSERGGPLSVAPDGRLEGQVPLKLDPGKLPALPLLQALGLLGPVNLTFHNGRAAIGPIPVGPAPKVG